MNSNVVSTGRACAEMSCPLLSFEIMNSLLYLSTTDINLLKILELAVCLGIMSILCIWMIGEITFFHGWVIWHIIIFPPLEFLYGNF